MNLVFFEDAVKHLVRVSRVLHHSRGSAMLIGIGGSGKQSLTRLAAAIADCACSQIEATASYSPQDFRDDLKEVMHVAGVEGKHVVLLLSDTQVWTRTTRKSVVLAVSSACPAASVCVVHVALLR